MSVPECNSVRCLDSYQWKTWVPVEELSPEFSEGTLNGKKLLIIKGKGKDSSYGKWITSIEDITEGQMYNFSVDYLTKNIARETLSVQAILTWRKKDGNPVQKDYADVLTIACDGWKSLSRTIAAPSGAEILDVELALRYPENGFVYWSNPILKTAPADRERKVKIASPLVFIRKNLTEHSLDINHKFMLGVIDDAAKLNPDVICLGEKNFEDCMEDAAVTELADTIPGARTAAVAQKAKLYNCYIIFSMAEKEGNNYYNTAVLIDRKGNIIGKYRKSHLPLSEAESGYAPGNDYPVFETDFGKIGIMICWDQMFPEIARIMAMKGAEIIFIPTQGDALVQQEARAIDNTVYIVTSGIYRPTSSRIIDPMGKVLAVADEEHDYIALAELDMNQKYYKNWMSVGPCDGEARSLYIKERRPDTYQPVAKDI